MQEIERFRIRDLPHWDVPGATYFVTSCLHGSIPARGLLDIVKYQQKLQDRRRRANVSLSDWKVRCWKMTFARIDHWLDQEPAVRHLQQPELATIVMNSLLKFAGERYAVFAFAVMPSHVHWVFRPSDNWVETLVGERTPRERIMQGMKGFTAKECNKVLSQSGIFWQDESYDHWVRDIEELERVILYVENNPVVAKLAERPEDWPFSSAYYRHKLGLPLGSAIPRIG